MEGNSINISFDFGERSLMDESGKGVDVDLGFAEGVLAEGGEVVTLSMPGDILKRPFLPFNIKENSISLLGGSFLGYFPFVVLLLILSGFSFLNKREDFISDQLLDVIFKFSFEVVGDQEVNGLFAADGDEVHSTIVIYVNNIIRDVDSADDFGSLDVPEVNEASVVTGNEEFASGVDSHGTDGAFMAAEGDVLLGREGLEFLGLGEVRQDVLLLNVEFFLDDSGAHKEVAATVKFFLDGFVVLGDFPEGTELLDLFV